MVVKVRLNKQHGHDVKFSPYYPDRVAVASGQFYGLAGRGACSVITIDPVGSNHRIVSLPWGDSLFSVTWSENNENLLATGSGDGQIQLYDVNVTQGPVRCIKAHSREVSSVEWCQARIVSHLFISSSWDQSLKIWDSQKLECVSQLPTCHSAIIYDVKSSPLVSDTFASASGDGAVKIWSMTSPQKLVSQLPAHPGAEVLSVDWCKYDQNILATAGTDSLAKIWDVRSPGQPLSVLAGHQYAVRRVRFSPYHKSVLYTASYDFTIKSWDFLQHSHCLRSFDHHTEFVCGLDFNLHIPNQAVSCSWDETVACWTEGLPS